MWTEQIDPSYALSLVMAGEYCLQEGRLRDAIREFKAALRVDSQCSEAHIGLGVAYSRLGRFGDAVEQYEAALEISWQNWLAHLNLGHAYANQGYADAAIGEYEEVLRWYPDHADALLGLGVVYLDQQKWAEAVRRFEALLQHHPDHAGAHNNLGLAYISQGRLGKAIEQHETAVSIDPRDEEFRYNLGRAYARQGQSAAAIRQFTTALRINPRFSPAHIALGMLCKEQGRRGEAINQYRTAARLGNAEATKLLAQLGLRDTDASTASQDPATSVSRQRGLVIATEENIGELLSLAEPPQRVWWEKAEMELCLVPAGEFLMGSQWDQGIAEDNPEHAVRLDAYYIGRYPVTQSQYAQFVQETGHPVPYCEEYPPYNWDLENRTPPPGMGAHPAVIVSWHDSVAYCQWAGLRLPTEAEWEKAARGTDGRKYPWGNDEPTAKLCNFDANEGGITRVGRYAPQGDSPYGCSDMAGNVWEWCADWYDETHYHRSAARNPSGPSSGDSRIARGGSCASYTTDFVRSAYRMRFIPWWKRMHLGFRCVRGPDRIS